MKKNLDFKLVLALVFFGIFLLIGIDAYFLGPLFSLFDDVFFYFPALFSVFADWWFILLVCVFVVGIFFYLGKKEEMYFFIAIVLIGELLKSGFKLLFQIPRPVDGLLTYAYPSGHAFSALLVYLLIWYFFFPKRKYVAIPLILALLVGLSRIGLKVHWISDILGGYLLAASLFMVVLFISNTRIYRQYARMDEF